ncbi:MAG TPA: NFACT RNA binding domain-containing protein [Candidatus Obscuribacterales bacterium]
MRAVLQEARPLLLNRKVEKVYQLGRDEIVLAMRLKTGIGHFILSAQASLGRMCLTAVPSLPKHVNPPAFCQLLRKHLSSAMVIDAHQVDGERVVDLTFACTDELGGKSTKVLTAEIMGRHSNLIFWDKQTEKIIGASHVVTSEMSRQREVAPGLKYVRPPQQDKFGIFELQRSQFDQAWQKLQASMQQASAGEGDGACTSWEQWLISTFSGIGRHLAEELLAASGVRGELSADDLTEETADRLFRRINEMQIIAVYKPAMRLDLTRYTVLSWWPELQTAEAAEWKRFPAVNDMVDEYFRTLHQREQLQQLRDRIRSELKTENDKLESRAAAATKQLESAGDLDRFKAWGDLILANMANISAGQSELVCDDLYATDGGNGQLAIALNPNLSPAQNAQHYYRQFAKGRVRKQAATGALSDAQSRMETLRQHMQELEAAAQPEELSRLKEMILDRGKRAEQKTPPTTKQQQQRPQGPAKTPRLMSTRSSDGWLIIIGRNKHENDVLLSKLAHPADLWLHVQGQEGAHVLIKNPNKQDPPQSTLHEAAQLAARFSRVSLGTKVRVVYTHVKYVKKIGGKDKPGLVRYEKERTIEVDTSAPMPPSLRKLFAK